MGHVGHELTAHLLVALQGVRQLIEVTRQLADLIGGGHRHAAAVFSGREAMGRSGNAFDRVKQCSRDPQGNQHRQQQGKHTHRQAGTQLILLKTLTAGFAHTLKGGDGQPAYGLAVHLHRAHELVVVHTLKTHHQIFVGIQQGDSKHRAGQIGSRGRSKAGNGEILRRVRAHDFKPAFPVIAQELPIAFACIGTGQARQDRRHALHCLLVEIAEKTATEAPVGSQAHNQDHRQHTGKDRDKQFGGDARFHEGLGFP